MTHIKHTPGPTTSLSCGCMVGHELQSPYFPIRHCPLHAAAPELLEAAKAAIEHLEVCQAGRILHPSRSVSRPLLEAAIAKAEEVIT